MVIVEIAEALVSISFVISCIVLLDAETVSPPSENTTILLLFELFKGLN